MTKSMNDRDLFFTNKGFKIGKKEGDYVMGLSWFDLYVSFDDEVYVKIKVKSGLTMDNIEEIREALMLGNYYKNMFVLEEY